MLEKLPKTIKQTQKGLIEKKFSAVELVDAYLARIEKYDEDLTSFITVSEDQAYTQAKRVDEILSSLGQKALAQFPLLGVVAAFKDLYSTQGVRTTAGAKVLSDYVPAYSATVVEKLGAAGIVMMGKTNCDAWAHGASGENSDFGPTKNPWDQNYVPGGSSSGSAAAVAAGLSLVAMGTDTGGSVRQPASFCNLVGLKPTYGAVSRYGVVAMASSLDCMGHLTHTVEDSRKIFAVTKGPDGFDATVKLPAEFSHKDIKKTFNSRGTKNSGEIKNSHEIKIGIPKEYFTQGLDSGVEETIRQAIKVFEKEGVRFVEVSLPHTQYAISAYYIIQPAEVSSNLGRYDGIRFGKDRSAFGDEAKRRIMLGTYVLSAGYYDAYYLTAMRVRSKICADFEKVFEGVDAVIAPVAPTPPFRLGEKTNDPLEMYLSDIFSVSANLAGIPGLAIPGGFTKLGLPVGFQLMGPRFSENLLLDLGELYQANTNWHEKEPKL